MSKKSYYDFEETKNWNIAKSYSDNVILDHVLTLKELQRIMLSGSPDFNSHFVIEQEMKDQAKKNAMDWFCEEMMMLYDDSLFAIKNKSDRESFTKWYNEIRKIYTDLVPKCSTMYNDGENESRYWKIRKDKYDKVAGSLFDIKRDVLKILNDSNLIFNAHEEFDPDKFKQDFERDFVSGG